MDNRTPLADIISKDRVSNADLDDKENAFTTLRGHLGDVGKSRKSREGKNCYLYIYLIVIIRCSVKW